MVNCHLSAGPEQGRRLRQVHDAVEFVRKDLAMQRASKHTKAAGSAKGGGKKKGSKPKAGAQEQAAPPEVAAPEAAAAAPATKDEAALNSTISSEAVVLVVGDLNAEASRPSGVASLLETGECGPLVLEDGVQVLARYKSKALEDGVQLLSR